MDTESNPNHQQFEIGVKALITREHRILMLLRKDFDTWDVPGGRINQGEDIVVALKRELKEELSAMHVSIGGVAHCQEVGYELPNGNRLMLLFYKVRAALSPNVALSTEHKESCWASMNELDDMPMHPAIRLAAKTMLGD